MKSKIKFALTPIIMSFCFWRWTLSIWIFYVETYWNPRMLILHIWIHLDHFDDIIAARNTVAKAENKDSLNMLTTTVRPNYGKSFYKIISRQRLNLMAISAFNPKTPSTKENSAPLLETPASFYKPSTNKQRARRSSVVSDVLQCEKIITGERRKTIHCDKQLKEQLHRRKLVKDLEIKTTSSPPRKVIPVNRSFSMSQTTYEEFLKKKRQQRNKECRDVIRSTASVMARMVSKQSQMTKANANNKHECFFETDTGSNQQHMDWVRKCMMSCTRTHWMKMVNERTKYEYDLFENTFFFSFGKNNMEIVNTKKQEGKLQYILLYCN